MAVAVNKPNICVLTTSYPRYNGDEAGIFVKRLVDAWALLGIKGIVIVPRDAKEGTESSAGFSVIRTPYTLFMPAKLAFGSGIFSNLGVNPLLIVQLPGLLFSMLWQLKKHKGSYDLVQANWILSAGIAFIWKKISGTPYIVTLRGRDSELAQSKLLGWIIGLIFKHASAIVTVNNGLLEKLINIYPHYRHNLKHIANGVSYIEPSKVALDEFREKHAIAENSIVFVGTIIPVKDIATLIEATALLKRRKIQLILCGRIEQRAYFEDLKKLIAGLGIENFVRFEGAIPPEQVPLYLSCARYYVSASKYEGRPNSVLEALAAGKVVLVSDINPHKELINDGVNGRLFELGSARSLAEVISNLEPDPALREKLSCAARSSPCLRTWGECALEYLEIASDTLLPNNQS